MTKWSFEADYFTACNCDWGCPCNFNARPTEGRCIGWGVWNIITGRFGDTSLDGTRFALYYMFPGLIERGQGTACTYIDTRVTSGQHKALEAIGTGKAGGGIFEIFTGLVTDWMPTEVVPIECDFNDGVGRARVGTFGEAESALLSYPDGSVIRPWQELPHGIEFKRAMMTNARRWWWRHDDLLAHYTDRYGAVARVKFTEAGCVG
jgi:hypothetical protein